MRNLLRHELQTKNPTTIVNRKRRSIRGKLTSSCITFRRSLRDHKNATVLRSIRLILGASVNLIRATRSIVKKMIYEQQEGKSFRSRDSQDLDIL